MPFGIRSQDGLHKRSSARSTARVSAQSDLSKSISRVSWGWRKTPAERSYIGSTHGRGLRARGTRLVPNGPSAAFDASKRLEEALAYGHRESLPGAGTRLRALCRWLCSASMASEQAPVPPGRDAPGKSRRGPAGRPAGPDGASQVGLGRVVPVDRLTGPGLLQQIVFPL